MNFIKLLIEKEDLIEVDCFGSVTQSSLSKWSKIDDAQQAIKDKDFKDFAFHTEKEKNPWWRIDFFEPQDITHIIINNRKRKPFDERASNIEVHCLLENREKVLLHKGNLVFGSLPETMPLILSMYNNKKIISIIISLNDTNYLHLCNIKILAKTNSLQKIHKKKMIFSNRKDGVGERIKSLLNTILLSELTGNEFKFSWKVRTGKSNTFHATSNANIFFENGYIEKNIIDSAEIDSMNLVPLKKVQSLKIASIDSYDGILVNQASLSSQLGFNIPKSNLSYKKAFDSIGFSSKIMEAKKLAQDVLLSENVVAIHLRAGDIVYGDYRFTNNCFSKVIPAFVIEALIEKYKNEGYQVLLFSQDKIFCEGLAKIHNVIYANNIYNIDFDDSQAAIFDITLMSRSNLIVSGTSGFSILSSWIGGISSKYFTSIFTPAEVANIFKEALGENGVLNRCYTSPLMKSYSIMYFLLKYGSNLESSYKLKLINKCIDLDPENTFLKLIESNYLFESKNFYKAEKNLLNLIESKNKYNIDWLIRTNKLTMYLDCIKESAQIGSTIAAVILLLCEERYGGDISIDFYENILLDPLDDTLGYELLTKELKRVLHT